MESGELLFAVLDGAKAESVPVTTLAAANLMERDHLQEWVVAHPAILGDDVMIVTVEYDGWIVDGGAQRDRLDVLALDRSGRLIVAELKRGVASDMVEMQAVKYAAMASRFDLATLAAAHASFRAKRFQPTTTDQAIEAMTSFAESLSDETIADPRIVLVAQGFRPIVISSVVWLANRGIDISLVRFQPYRLEGGQVFVTFSRLFPLPELSIVGPGTPVAEVPTNELPHAEWTTLDLIGLGRVANLTTRTALDLCAEKPDVFVSLTDIVEAAGISRPTARAQLAGLTMVMKRRFGRRNWPFKVHFDVDGTSQAFYRMTSEAAGRWRDASIQLDVEQSDDATTTALDSTPDEADPV